MLSTKLPSYALQMLSTVHMYLKARVCMLTYIPHTLEQLFKIPLSFYYTGWFVGIPLLDYDFRYSKIHNQPTVILNTADGC